MRSLISLWDRGLYKYFFRLDTLKCAGFGAEMVHGWKDVCRMLLINLEHQIKMIESESCCSQEQKTSEEYEGAFSAVLDDVSGH